MLNNKVERSAEMDYNINFNVNYKSSSEKVFISQALSMLSTLISVLLIIKKDKASYWN